MLGLRCFHISNMHFFAVFQFKNISFKCTILFFILFSFKLKAILNIFNFIMSKLLFFKFVICSFFKIHLAGPNFTLYRTIFTIRLIKEIRTKLHFRNNKNKGVQQVQPKTEMIINPEIRVCSTCYCRDI